MVAALHVHFNAGIPLEVSRFVYVVNRAHSQNGESSDAVLPGQRRDPVQQAQEPGLRAHLGPLPAASRHLSQVS